MNATSTHYLLKHLYGETEPTETLAIEDALAVNDYLSNAYESWKMLHKMMQEVKMNPSERVIQNILQYSVKHRALTA
jgi:hypothetical protein